MVEEIYLSGSVRLPIPPTNNVTDLIEAVSAALKLSSADFYLTQNGKLINNTKINNNNHVNVYLRLVGGKGGFGSMLRAIGAQIEKTTNREACRDLSGRRLRDINEEKRLKSWLEKQDEHQGSQANKRAKKIEKLRAQPKHEFKDEEYLNARSNLVEDVSDALEVGLKNASTASTSIVSVGRSSKNDNESGKSANATKRKKNKLKNSAKKLKGAQWIDEDLSSNDSNNSSENESSKNKTDSIFNIAKSEANL